MTEYLIAFNDEWVPDHTVEELREKSKATRALVAEMGAADDRTQEGRRPVSSVMWIPAA